MLKQAKEIFKLLSLAGSFCICLFSVAYAQMFEAQSASYFARTHGGEEFADVLDKKAGQVICGNKDTICSKDEICLKCREMLKDKFLGMDRYGFTWEKGKCVPAQGFDETRLQDYWPSCNMQPDIDINLYVTSFKSNSALSVEPDGFLAQQEVRLAFIPWRRNLHEFTDSDGKKYELYIKESGATITFAGDNSYEGCEVLPVKVYNLRGCFFCPLTRLIFGASNVVTAGAFGTFAASLKVVISVVFFIWLALAVLQQVSTFTKQDAPKLLAAILKQAFKFSIAFLLLTYPGEIFGKFILPVLNSGVNMGTAIMEPVKVLTTDETNALIQQKSDEEVAYAAKNSVIMGDGFYNQRPGGPNSNEPTFYERLENYLSSLQTKLAYMQAIGTTLICVGSHDIITTSYSDLVAGFRMMIIGVVITVFALLLTISFAFMFLDTILELAIIGAMLPLMIAGWPFKVTAQYASTGLKMLLNVFFVMFFLGFTISINFNLVDQSLSVSQEISSDTSVADKTQQAQSGFEAIAEAINEQNIEKLRKATDIGGIGFLLLVFSCLFGWKVIQQTSPLANKMSPGFSPGIATNIGTMAASTVKTGVSKLTKPARSVMSEMWHDAGGVVGIVSSPGALVGELADAAGRGLNKGGHTGWGKAASGVGKVLKFPHKAAKFVHKTYKDNKPPK